MDINAIFNLVEQLDNELKKNNLSRNALVIEGITDNYSFELTIHDKED